MALGVVLSGTASDGTLGLEAGSPLPRMIRPNTTRCLAAPWRQAVWISFPRHGRSPKKLARIAMHPYIAGKSPQHPISAEDEAAAATAHEDDQSPLHSGGHEMPRAQEAKQVRAEAEREELPSSKCEGARRTLL